MFKQLSTSLLIASACILSSCTPTVKQEIAILPTPVSLTEQSGLHKYIHCLVRSLHVCS